MSERGGWLSVREKGGVLGVRWMFWLATAFGRGAARAFLAVLVLYYVTFHRGVRRSSADYLGRIDRRPPSFGRVYAHVLRFAHVAVDRLFLIAGKDRDLVFESHGTEHLRAAQETGRGAILLGAHLGSFEAMRRVARGRNYRVNVVGYFKNAAAINDTLRKVNPDLDTRLIEIDPGGVDFVLTLRECIEKGEFVAILADRVGLGGKTTEVDFLGEKAPFPLGPYLLASTLRCPVFLTFGLFTEPNRYDLYCEPFADRIELPRGGREQAASEYAARYVRRLEAYCRKAPDNWFNFYDFWKP